jgi:hypothetical protein
MIPQEHKLDPLYRALYNTDTIFGVCKQSDVDMLSSFETMAGLWKENKASSMAHVLLAWGITGQSTNMKLVGAITFCDSYESIDLATDRTLMSDSDFNTLKPYLRAKTLLIDCLCSTSKGAATALVLNAIKFAITKQCQYVLCLSFSSRKLAKGQKPASAKLLEKLGFKTLIKTANFVKQGYHGSWCLLDLHNDNLHLLSEGLMKLVVNVCARPGLTAKTAGVLVNRCPS